MAFTQPYSSPQGWSAPEAYFRTARVVYDYAAGTCSIHVEACYNQAAREADSPPIAEADYTLSDDDLEKYFGDAVFEDGKTDPRKQAYLYLATRREFAGAVAV